MATSAQPQTPASVQAPDFVSLLRQFKAEIFFTLNCHLPGTIISFNAEKQTAEVSVNLVRMIGGQAVNYPPLVDCPVFVNSGGGARVTFPIAAGDTCVVHFADTDIDNWFASGTSSLLPNTSRAHSLSDGFVEVGFRSAANPVPDYSTDSADFHGGAHKLDIKNNGGTLKGLLDLLSIALTSLNSGRNTGSIANSTAKIADFDAAKSLLLK
jgi:hypothetical protein